MYKLLTFGLIAAGLAAPAQAQDAAAGEAVFKRNCTACHSAQEGKNLLGPSLFGIVGRAAGTAPNFTKYSAANKNSGITWTPAVLGPYLTDPRGYVKGTIMVFPGVKDAKQRADLIAYLETLK